MCEWFDAYTSSKDFSTACRLASSCALKLPTHRSATLANAAANVEPCAACYSNCRRRDCCCCPLLLLLAHATLLHMLLHLQLSCL